MYQLLNGMRIVEAGSFIAAPSCGLHLLQMGAEVIRIDTIGGGPDFRRWPIDRSGTSLYWEGLNKGKRSITFDLSSAEGRELAIELVTSPGDSSGMFVTNFPASGFLSYEGLRKRREDLILLRVMGRANGAAAVDYTVNSAYGIPHITGPAELGDAPVNHVLPAWDLLAGAYGAFALLAAERQRRISGAGVEIRVPLDDVAIASLGNLGQIAETVLEDRDRPRVGNDLFGAFGRDFLTADGRRIMVVAITARQWTGLVAALGINRAVESIEARTAAKFAQDEGARFIHRDELNSLVGSAIAARACDDVTASLDRHGGCWGPYRTMHQALNEDPALSSSNPMLSMVDHISGNRYLTAGAPAALSGIERLAPGTAPRLGEHTDEILASMLGMTSSKIGDLRDRKIVA